MGRKTIILREDQFNEICGTNTAYLDNNNDYAEDGTVTTKAAGAVSDSNGEKEYSEPITGKEWGHELAPETLFALLFRNGGNGLWGHWGSGLRSETLNGFDSSFDNDVDIDDDSEEGEDDAVKKYFSNEDLKYLFEEVNPDADCEEELFNKCFSYLKKTEYGDNVNLLGDTIYDKIEQLSGDNRFYELDFKKQVEIVIRETMKKIDREYYWEEYAGQPLPKLGHLFESNSELEGNTYVMDLGDGKKKRSYTSLTTEKNELEQEIVLLRRKGNLTPEEQAELEKKMNRLYKINMKLGVETKRVKDSKRIKKDIFGDNNAFLKPHTKNSKNGKAHSKKIKDPNVGTGFITYA